MKQLTLFAFSDLTPKGLGWVIAALIFVLAAGFALYVVLAGRNSKGSELVLAPNRKKYLDDEELETKRLDGALLASVGLLMVVAVILPVYWLAEGGRQAGAVKGMTEKFVVAGAEIYETKAQCVACHGPEATGGVASQVLTDPNGKYVATVSWNAPALNTVLWRFSEDEVRYILNYGRPGSPMAAWGLPGGGPYNAQQIDQVIEYLWSIQLSEAEMRTQVDDKVKSTNSDLYTKMMAVRAQNEEKAQALSQESGQTKTVLDIPPADLARLDAKDELFLGEILFNMTDVSGGAYSCARCHIPGAAFGKAGATFNTASASGEKNRTDLGGNGAMGPDLAGIQNGSTDLQRFNLINTGTENGKGYFTRRIGSGKMPGFGLNPSAGIADTPQLGAAGMYTPEQVWAVTMYVGALDTAPTTTGSTEAAASNNTTTTTAPAEG